MKHRPFTSSRKGRVLGAMAVATVSLVLTAPGAAAQDAPDYVGQPNPVVDVPGNDGPGAVDAGGGAKSNHSSGGYAASAARNLPLTGTDILGLTGVGAAAIAVGTVLARRSRRSRRDLVSDPSSAG